MKEIICNPKETTWEDLLAMEPGTIVYDAFEEGIRFIIMRGPASLCGYAGIPNDHPLAGYSYEDLPVDAHGGLTFARCGDNESNWPDGYYWYGWDYAHSGDYCFYNDEALIKSLGYSHEDEHKWLINEVIKDSWGTCYDIKRLMKLAENIKSGS